MQYEAAWVLTNIASGSSEQTQAVVEGGAVAVLLQQMISSPHTNIQEQCVWCLGNIAGDSVRMRDALLQAGTVNYILQFATVRRETSTVTASVCRDNRQYCMRPRYHHTITYLTALLLPYLVCVVGDLFPCFMLVSNWICSSPVCHSSYADLAGAAGSMAHVKSMPRLVK